MSPDFQSKQSGHGSCSDGREEPIYATSHHQQQHQPFLYNNQQFNNRPPPNNDFRSSYQQPPPPFPQQGIHPTLNTTRGGSELLQPSKTPAMAAHQKYFSQYVIMQITLNPFILSLKVTVVHSDPTPSCAFIVKERSLRMLGTSIPKPLRSMNTVRCLTLAIPSTLQDQIVTVLSCKLRQHVNIFGADFVTNGTPMSGSLCRPAEGARKLTRPP